jgi:carbamoyl-phosphate synthase small subunit
MKAMLMLEDGKCFSGETSRPGAKAAGEVILNTAVVGYQEMLTDPANAGKILALTYPLIGNYGCAPKFNESKKVWVAGLVIKEKTRIFSNWQAKQSFDDFVKENNLTLIYGVDTRTLAVHLRQKGQMLGMIAQENAEKKELLAKLADLRKGAGKSFLPEISVAKPVTLGKEKSAKKVAVLDLGITNSVIKQMEALGLSLTLLPYNTQAKEVLRQKPQALVISSGPEEDPGLKETITNVKELVGKLPILGIACGAEVLAQALGAKVTKLHLGHRGVNYPVQNPASYKGEITAQNHSFCVDADSLAKIKDVKITGYNLNDRSVEEFESKKRKFTGIQYVPSSPGFSEINPALKKFALSIGRRK